MIPDTGARTGSERQVLPPGAPRRPVRGEPPRVEPTRGAPQRGVVMERIDPDDDVRAGRNLVAVDGDIAHCPATDRGRGWTGPQCFMDHLDGAGEVGHVVHVQWAIAECGDLRRHPILDRAIAPQGPEAVCQGGRGGVVSGKKERPQLLADRAVVEATDRARVVEQRRTQRGQPSVADVEGLPRVERDCPRLSRSRGPTGRAVRTR